MECEVNHSEMNELPAKFPNLWLSERLIRIKMVGFSESLLEKPNHTTLKVIYKNISQ